MNNVTNIVMEPFCVERAGRRGGVQENGKGEEGADIKFR